MIGQVRDAISLEKPENFPGSSEIALWEVEEVING